jgi:glycerophosphoryl diester phosphodiesterase
VIDLTKEEGVGIYPETKHPTYFDGIGLSLEEPLVETLNENGYTKRSSPLFIQSFEVKKLKELNRMTRVPIVQLISDVGKPWDFVLANGQDLCRPRDAGGPQGDRQLRGRHRPEQEPARYARQLQPAAPADAARAQRPSRRSRRPSLDIQT